MKLAARKPRRPFFLWVLALGLLWVGYISALRLYGALTGWDTLRLLAAQPGPFYLAITGGVFALAFITAALAVFVWARWGGLAARGTALSYAAWYWFDRLAFGGGPQAQVNWPFAFAFTLVLLGFVFLASSLFNAYRSVYSSGG